MRRPLGLLALLLWVLTAWGQTLQPIPPLSGRVVDGAGWLSPAERSQLEARLAEVEARRGSQIAILLVTTTQPEPIEAYSIRVVDAWKLGHQGVDDGVLILVARQDRTLRIEVGRGLEGAIPDAVAKRIIEEQMLPRFRAGETAAGLAAGLAAVEARLAGEALPEPAHAPDHGSGGSQNWIGIAFLAAFLGGNVLRAILGPIVGPGVAACLVGGGVWWLTSQILLGLGAGFFTLIFFLGGGGRGGSGPWISGGRGGFGGGGNSGGWSGGGGGFSGGGASGRW